MKPTDEQIREFWEKCGVKPRNLNEYGRAPNIDYPPIDLNNLFKYAVPKVVKNGECSIFLRLCAGEGWTKKGWLCSVTDTTPADKYGRSEGIQDPALALFWAIWEVKK